MAIDVPIVMYCLRMFIVVLPNYLHICMIEVRDCYHHQVSLLYTLWFLRYCLRLFIVVLQELHCLPNYLHIFIVRVIGCYHITKFRYSTPSGF